MKDRNPWANLSEQKYSSRHLNRARQKDPQASSKRDQHVAGWIQGAERRLGGHRTGGSEGSIRFKCYNAGTDPIEGVSIPDGVTPSCDPVELVSVGPGLGGHPAEGVIGIGVGEGQFLARLVPAGTMLEMHLFQCADRPQR